MAVGRESRLDVQNGGWLKDTFFAGSGSFYRQKSQPVMRGLA
ncbi:hypothetical protein HMPREF0201_02109 [Cedecea davisae DSM 4568]|uniref:Uncharacterized protein n=1 Tax=Cedecea davisae DSM 4568 TaxID=566551 RepID=S3JUP3_9ENTR|nr:hypothetical protein HMPREF0201_02109 [Cedecea davisae DSM 4568]